MKKKDIEEITTALVNPVLKENDFELIDVEFTKEGPNKILRLYIDKEGGITIDDCQLVSEYLSDKLDEADPIEENYFLEVSSPGLDRPLKTDKDLRNNIGNDVEINLFKSYNGKKHFSSILLSFDDKIIKIKDEELGELKIGRELISKINLAVKF